jgi:hypothetical protein
LISSSPLNLNTQPTEVLRHRLSETNISQLREMNGQYGIRGINPVPLSVHGPQTDERAPIKNLILILILLPIFLNNTDTSYALI